LYLCVSEKVSFRQVKLGDIRHCDHRRSLGPFRIAKSGIGRGGRLLSVSGSESYHGKRKNDLQSCFHLPEQSLFAEVATKILLLMATANGAPMVILRRQANYKLPMKGEILSNLANVVAVLS
jgi:hypothetical protein